MSDNETKKPYSRRKFIRDVTSGMIGTTVVIKSIPAAAKAETGKKPSKEHGAQKQKLTFVLNNKQRMVKIRPETTLAELLRHRFKLTGTKVVCNHGECGGCTVVVDDEAVYSCHMLALDVEGKQVVTIEGLLEGEELHSIQKAFVKKDGMQCGFCTPGQIMTAYAFLLKHPDPDRDQVVEAMSGNICRCGAYNKIVDSVLKAAKMMKQNVG